MKKLFNPSYSEWNSIMQRPALETETIEKTVRNMFNEVRLNGDQAVDAFSLKYDGVVPEYIKVSSEAIDNAQRLVSTDLKKAIALSKANIEKFHKKQRSARVEVETTPGVLCWQEKRPIQKVGLYIPGGSAPLFSTVLMLAIPAIIAGCEEIILCTPPAKDGEINPAIIYAASLCGVDQIYKVGGIQAIAAMTFGTDRIPKVYKIFGPGNQYVTIAKQIAMSFGLAIDMPAGPSELMVVADETSNAAFMASDLLSQAEHGPDSQVFLLTTSKELLYSVEEALEEQIRTLPRADIAKQAMANSRLIFMEEEEMALKFLNEYGPEHLIVCMANESYFLDNLVNAGSVFLGNYTPESAGDYASGTNHTLPTNGYARQYSGVNLDSFMKSITFQRISEEGILNLGETIEVMADAEGLEAHKRAVSLRLKYLKENA